MNLQYRLYLAGILPALALALVLACASTALAQDVKTLARDLAKGLAEAYEDNQPEGLPKKPLVLVSANRFADPQSKNVHPFPGFLLMVLRPELGREGFVVTDDLLAKVDLTLAGNYFVTNGKIVVACRLVAYDKARTARDVASTRAEMDLTSAGPDWFTEDAKSKVLFLMSRLQDKAALALAMQSRPTVLIQPFGFEQGKLYSRFSDYIGQCALEFLTGSDLLLPLRPAVAEANTRGAAGTRNILVHGEATVAGVAGASHTLSGGYWRLPNDTLEITASLIESSGKVLAAESVTLPASAAGKDMLALPQTEDKAFMTDYAAWKETKEDKSLSVVLQTQKGRTNLSFQEGEDILFLFTSSQPAYVRVFNRGADGAIYQIFPNEFDNGLRPLPAGIPAAIPDKSQASVFGFAASPPFGNELVTIFASDKPLPELPGTDIGVHGLRRMALSADEIRRRYDDHCRQKDQLLATDFIALRTSAKK